jgi:putative hydrolase of the HAD superfamily
MLAAVRGAGQRIGVLSNWQPSLVDVLASTGLDTYVDVVIPSTTAGVAKPSPAAFLKAADALGVGAEHLLHVGDQLVDDVLGALRAGCRAALATQPLHALSAAFRRTAG